ncbi:hypothetical protein [Mycolicibacterium sp.]|uniref:hypothetical protein n=1 Tax=Mycolicibacterium sp. TaxID=2320850 RepID=UPI0025D91913|nr:hypothetical protein [Mycolicibacterium sp.]
MTNSESMWLIRIGASFVLLAAGLGVSAGPAAADDPVMHEVTYTVYTDAPFFSEIYYRDFEPANFADYSHDPYLFSPNVEANLGPDKPWVLTVRLANPEYWAMVLGSSGRSPNPPNFHCTLAVDGAVVITNSGAKGALCSLRTW